MWVYTVARQTFPVAGEKQLEAVILAGGLGTRLRSVVCDRPKPMALVNGQPFVAYLVKTLKDQGVERIVFSTGFLAHQVSDYFGTGDRWGIEIAYSQETEPLGTGGAVRLALEQIQAEQFLVLNGDSYCPFDLKSLLNFHRQRQARATLLLAPVEDCSRYGSVVIDREGSVLAFQEKQAGLGAGLVNAGVYVLDWQTVKAIPSRCKVSLETEFFPSLVGRGLYATSSQSKLLDIGTPESYALATEFLAAESLI